jgi:hypothetical protein
MESQSNAKFTDCILQSVAKYVVMAMCLMGAFMASSVHAATVALKVVSARTVGTVPKGTLVTSYKYLINVDNTGTTEQRSPALGTGCNPGDVDPVDPTIK